MAKQGELSGKSQDYFGIPAANQSTSEWGAVVKLLADMRTQLLPSGKLKCLLGAYCIPSVLRISSYPCTNNSI